MTGTTTTDSQCPRKAVVDSTSPRPQQVLPSVCILGRWAKWASVAPSTTPEIAPSISETAANSTTASPSCGRCEELKIQSNINQSMLNECATLLKVKKTELGDSQIKGKTLQAQLDATNQANAQLRLDQVHFTRKLQSMDRQLDEQTAESTLRADICNELTAQLTQQHKELTDAHIPTSCQEASLQQDLTCLKTKLEAKSQEILCLQEHAHDQVSQEVAHKTATRSKENALEQDTPFDCELAQSYARIAELEAEIVKLYAQLSTENDWNVGESVLDEAEGVDDAAETVSP